MYNTHSPLTLMLALEAGDLGTFSVDIASGVRTACARALRMHGLPPDAPLPAREDVLGRVHPEDRDRLTAAREAAMRDGTPLRLAYRVIHPDGSVHWLRVEAIAQRDADGTPLRVIGVLRDITDQRVAEDAQQRMQAALAEEVERRTQERDRMWRMSRELMAVTRPDGSFAAVNPCWTEVLGWREEEVVGRQVAEFLHPDDIAFTDGRRRALAAGQVPPRYENRYRHRDGSYRWIEWMAAGADGLIYGVGRDVTEQKAAAEALAAAHRQLLAEIAEREQVEATLRQMQRLEAVGQLTSGVAHDFNNLLTVILGNLEFLRRGNLAPQHTRRLDMMQQAAARGADLTSHLLAFARRQRLEPKPTDLNEIVGGMTDLLASTLGGLNRVATELAPGLWPALVDRTQLELAILNLAINARDAMPGGGTLTLSTARTSLIRQATRRAEEPGPGDYVTVAVADTGTGMTPEVQAKAFEPFFTTKGVGKGSGLGLAQVFGFAKQSGGGVRIDTAPGAGTRVTLFLPRADTAEAEGEATAEAARGRPGGERQLVLLVDDDAGVREVTAALLDEMGYGVIEAEHGAAALAALAQRPEIALLIVDFAMPGMNGAEVARQALALRPGLPVLFVTGYGDATLLAAFGEDRIIAKPFRDEQLRRKVALALAEAATAGSGTVVRLRAAVAR